MTISKKAKEIIDYFDKILKDASCLLNYSKDYELVIAVMLSAQTTDIAVNKVTKILFSTYPSLESLNNADIKDIENIISPLGLYKNKAKNIKQIAYDLINLYNGKTPSNKEDLMKLAGVGNKTANVVLIELFQKEEFPVDTHIERISKRLNIANENDNVYIVEKKLRKKFPKNKYIRLHHQFIHFGRLICKSKNPQCHQCELQNHCKYYKSK